MTRVIDLYIKENEQYWDENGDACKQLERMKEILKSETKKFKCNGDDFGIYFGDNVQYGGR